MSDFAFVVASVLIVAVGVAVRRLSPGGGRVAAPDAPVARANG